MSDVALTRKKQRALSETERKILKEAFELFDSNNDGYLDYYEFKASSRCLGFHLKKSELLLILETYSHSNRNMICYEDFYEVSKYEMKNSGVSMSRNNYDWLEANRNTVREGTQALLRTSESLERSERVALETAETGTSIISELRSQTESLERAKDNLDHMNDQLTRSQKIINTLYRRVFTNKFIVILIILLEAIILGLVSYLKFFKKH